MNDVAPFGADIQTEMMEAACDILAAAVFVYDRSDTLVFASRQALRFYPIRPEVLKPGTRLRDVLGAIFDAGIRYGIPAEQKHKTVNREEWISARISAHWREQHDMVERLGRDRWVHFRKRRLPNGYNISTLTDVSELKKQEQQWRSDLERVALTEEVLDTLPNPVVIKDINLACVAVNQAFRSIYAASSESVLGRTVWDLVDPENAERIEASDRVVLETGEPVSIQEHIVRSDGTDLFVLTRKYRVGTPGRYMLVTSMEDVTEIAVPDGASSSTLKIRSLESFVQTENCFDPLREVEKRLLLQQLRSEDMDHIAGCRVLLATAAPRVESVLLEELRNHGADSCAVRDPIEFRAFLAAIEAKAVTIDLVLIDVNFADREVLALECGNTPVRFLSPQGSSADVLQALSAGHPPALSDDEPSGAYLDPGGMADDWYIATDIEEMPQAAVGDIEVLVAEDNQINQFVFSQILESLGVSHRIAENGEEAVALWRKHQPKLVLMDIAMPLKNGLDATLEIRELEKLTGTRTPIVAVTAQALNVDMQNCMDAGMDDYITKPVSPDMIEATYRRYVLETMKKSVA